jgi:formate/nitrite transporter FocA (FNT family)
MTPGFLCNEEGKRMKTSLTKAAAAGILICMGCIVNLKVGGGIPGAVLFSAGLWFVVNFDAELFTGRVTRDQYDPLQKLIMLLMNVIGAAVCGILASVFLPEIREAAQGIASAYQDPLKVIWQSVMCGICMYLATTPPMNRDVSRLPFVIYGVALFILSSYAHSIALAGYAAIAQGIAWWVIPLAAVGNGAGSYLMKGLLTGKLITRNL